MLENFIAVAVPCYEPSGQDGYKVGLKTGLIAPFVRPVAGGFN
jgi:hypothetical protein